MDNYFLQGIDTVILRVSDIQRAKLWYTEKLGFNNIHEDEKLRLVVLDNTYSPTSLTIWETDEKIQINPKTAPYPIFTAGDATTAHNKLAQLGVTVGDIISDHVVTYFSFYDLDGNMLEVCQVHS